MLSALAALLLTQTPASQSQNGTSPDQIRAGQTSAGQTPSGQNQVPKRPVVLAPAGPPATLEQLRAWDGWKFGAPTGEWPLRAAPFSAPIPALRPDDPTATTMKLKVFVLARTEAGPGGMERGTILPAGIERLRTALRNVQAVIRDASGGRVDLALAIAVDEDPADVTSGAEAISAYLRPRMNGGRFDAEDGVDRGPYSGVLVVSPTDVQPPTMVNGTPVHTLHYYRAGGEMGATELEANLLAATQRLMVSRLIGMGAPSQGPGAPTNGAWPSFNTITTDALVGLKPGIDAPTASLASIAAAQPYVASIPTPSGLLPYSAPVEVYLEADPARGTVLRYREPGEARLGGLSLPKDAIPTGKNLAFWTKVSGREGLALRFTGTGGASETILGPVEDEQGTELLLDGAWHRVVVAVPAGTSAMDLAPPRAREGFGRRDLQNVNAWFDDFEWTDETATPIVGGPSRAAAERLATATPADLAVLIADSTPRVRAAALAKVPQGAAELEAAVTARTTEIIPGVAREAVRALGRIGTPTALAALRRIVAVGPNEAARQAATRELGKTDDPTSIPTIAILLGRQSWRSRLAAVEALGAFKQENAVRFRLSATLQEIPELRLAALRPATTANPDERQKLLYAAINDPSDEVRAFASDRLLDSPNESDVTEGGRAAADDSPWTRVLFQRSLARRADVRFKPLTLKGLADPVGLVRAESLRALAALGPIEASEAGNVLNDPHPDVLLALIELQKGGKVTLPAATRALVVASLDARVKTARS